MDHIEAFKYVFEFIDTKISGQEAMEPIAEWRVFSIPVLETQMKKERLWISSAKIGIFQTPSIKSSYGLTHWQLPKTYLNWLILNKWLRSDGNLDLPLLKCGELQKFRKSEFLLECFQKSKISRSRLSMDSLEASEDVNQIETNANN